MKVMFELDFTNASCCFWGGICPESTLKRPSKMLHGNLWNYYKSHGNIWKPISHHHTRHVNLGQPMFEGPLHHLDHRKDHQVFNEGL